MFEHRAICPLGVFVPPTFTIMFASKLDIFQLKHNVFGEKTIEMMPLPPEFGGVNLHS